VTTHRQHTHSDVLIIGGGAIGLACAYYLAKSGCSVGIIEKETVGAKASHGNCGIVFVSDLPPLCVPGAIRHELIRTLRGTSPLYIPPRFDIGLAGWLVRFAANCTRRHRKHAMRVRNDLLGWSHALLKALVAEERLACDFAQRGLLMAFTDPAAMAGYAATSRLLEPYGLAATFFDRHAVHQLEPALGKRVCGGWHHAPDSHLRPERFIRELDRTVRAKGVVIIEGSPLVRVECRRGRLIAAHTPYHRYTADHYILAAGAWSPVIGRQLGLRLPVQPGKGYSITMQRPAVCPSMPCYLVERNTVVTPWKNGYRLGGTMEFSGFDDRLNRKRLANIEQSAAIYLRTPFGKPVIERWTGLRPMTPDDLPVIGRSPSINNLIVATGHGMLGISTATGTGRIVADMVLGKPSAIDPGPLSIERFRGRFGNGRR
jgi:D-amino-acid dehydrogenase